MWAGKPGVLSFLKQENLIQTMENLSINNSINKSYTVSRVGRYGNNEVISGGQLSLTCSRVEGRQAIDNNKTYKLPSQSFPSDHVKPFLIPFISKVHATSVQQDIINCGY